MKKKMTKILIVTIVGIFIFTAVAPLIFSIMHP